MRKSADVCIFCPLKRLCKTSSVDFYPSVWNSLLVWNIQSIFTSFNSWMENSGRTLWTIYLYCSIHFPFQYSAYSSYIIAIIRPDYFNGSSSCENTSCSHYAKVLLRLCAISIWMDVIVKQMKRTISLLNTPSSFNSKWPKKIQSWCRKRFFELELSFLRYKSHYCVYVLLVFLT